MKQKICFLFSSLFLLIFCTCSNNHKSIIIPHYQNYNHLYKDTKHRSDLMVLYLEGNLHLWEKSIYVHSILIQQLVKIGEYSKSLQLSKQLLNKKLNYYQSGKVYINMALSYCALQEYKNAQYYFDKAITRKNEYYYFLYARMEEYQTNYQKSLDLYELALQKKYKSYIQKAHARTLYKALLYYKKNDTINYQKYLNLSKSLSYVRKSRIKIIENGIIF